MLQASRAAEGKARESPRMIALLPLQVVITPPFQSFLGMALSVAKAGR